MPFTPQFRITPETAKALMAIEALRAAVDRLPITPKLIASLRESARLLSTHYSTQIEGNRLTLPEVEEVIAGRGAFPGRERDEREVRSEGMADAFANVRLRTETVGAPPARGQERAAPRVASDPTTSAWSVCEEPRRQSRVSGLGSRDG